MWRDCLSRLCSWIITLPCRAGSNDASAVQPSKNARTSPQPTASSRWDISVKEATPDAVSRAVVLAAGGQKAKYGALQAGWMPATPDEQARRLSLTTL